MILFFDTETTGLFDDKLPVDHPSQPYIVQLAACLYHDDGRQACSFNFIVNPGIDIPERASAVHGITNEVAAKLGMNLDDVMDMFQHMYRRSDLVCAHNMKFDRNIIEAAIARRYGAVMTLSKPLHCTMEQAAPIVNLPPTERMKAVGIDKPKPPRLEECVRFFFNESLEGAHDAMVDVTACARIYFHMNKEAVAQ